MECGDLIQLNSENFGGYNGSVVQILKSDGRRFIIKLIESDTYKRDIGYNQLRISKSIGSNEYEIL